MELKYYDGSTFKKAAIRRWNGTEWEYANLNCWNGTEWVSATRSPVSDFLVDTKNEILVKPNGEKLSGYSAEKFMSPYSYYFKNQMSYKVVQNYSDCTMTIEMWNPWMNRKIASTKITHKDAHNSEGGNTFECEVSTTKDRVIVMYNSITNPKYKDKKIPMRVGGYVAIFNLDLSTLLGHYDCTIGESTSTYESEYLFRTLNDKAIRVYGSDLLIVPFFGHTGSFVYCGRIDVHLTEPTVSYFKGDWFSVTNSNLFEKEMSLIYYNRKTSGLPSEWTLSISGLNLFNMGSSNDYDFLSYSVITSGANVKTVAFESFNYGGQRYSLNNKRVYTLFGNPDSHILDKYMVYFQSTTTSQQSTPVFTRQLKYATFRDVLGGNCGLMTSYKNTNGVNIQNVILNFDESKDTLEFRHLPDGTALMYLNDQIYTFTQMGDNFYIDYYGDVVNKITDDIIEVYGTNKEIIE